MINDVINNGSEVAEEIIFQFKLLEKSATVLTSALAHEKAAHAALKDRFETLQAQKIAHNDPNDIYVNENQYGVMVLRRGKFEFSSYDYNSNLSITRLIATLDTIPKDDYYYDYRARNTKIKKDCYHTDQNENFALMDFQGRRRISNVSGIESMSVEKYSSLIKFEKKSTNWGMILNFNQQQADSLRQDSYIYTFYKIKNVPTIFRLLVNFDFGCNTSNNKQGIIGGTVILPPNNTYTQPNPSGLGVTPPNQQ